MAITVATTELQNGAEMPSCCGFYTFGESRPVPKESEDDALLAKELNLLSMEEREKLYEEVRDSF